MSFWTPDAKEDAFMASRKEAERLTQPGGKVAGRACKTCGDTIRTLIVDECWACEKPSVEREAVGRCKTCGDAVDEIERLRAWYDASQDAMGEVLTELRKQTEMLERIRREQVRGE